MPESLHDVCRLCLSKDGLMFPIFLNQDVNNRIPLRHKIITCARIEVYADDGLPSKVCHNCFHKVEKSFEFRNTCEKSDMLLRYQLQNNMVKSDDDNDSVKHEDLMINIENGWKVVKNQCLDYENGSQDSVSCTNDDVCSQDNLNLRNNHFCFACLKSYTSIYDLIIHLEIEHQHLTSFPCNPCKLNFLNLQQLIDHFCQNHKDPNQCDQCDKIFKYTKNLEIHKNTHITHKCKYCQEIFGEINTLKEHENFHLEKICRFCCLELPTRELCITHTASCSQLHSCRFCGQLFSVKKQLIEHVNNFHDDKIIHKCTECEKIFDKLEELQDHSCDQSEESLQCKICQLEFTELSELDEHMYKHNTTVINCRFCSKKFTLKSSLRRHERSHSGLKPYQCKYCPRKFKDNSTCVVHIRTHTGEQPFQCNLCQKHFKQLANLKMHIYRHHKKGKINNQVVTSNNVQLQNQVREVPNVIYTTPELINDKGVQNVNDFSMDNTGVYQVLNISVPDFEHNVNLS